MYKKSNLRRYTDGFTSCDLQELNARAAMMTRIDNKYIIKSNDLLSLKTQLAENFDILEIKNERGFNYSTRYFDDAQRSAYYEHHQGRRKGFKVRIRRYLEARLCYVELKMKEKRGTTIKQRLDYDYNGYETLSSAALQFVKNGYQTHYGKSFGYKVQAVLDIEYQRLTLVSKDGAERMTIDTDLVFNNGQRRLEAEDGLFIVETKSENGRGYADKCLRSNHIYPAKRCSKYCVGMAALSEVTRFNHFLPTMRKLQILDMPIENTGFQALAA
jgi:hypothetical protein